LLALCGLQYTAVIASFFDAFASPIESKPHLLQGWTVF